MLGIAGFQLQGFVVFERLSAGVSNPHTSNLDRLTANPDGLALRSYEPCSGEPREHFA